MIDVLRDVLEREFPEKQETWMAKLLGVILLGMAFCWAFGWVLRLWIDSELLAEPPEPPEGHLTPADIMRRMRSVKRELGT